jgi:outer membrane protein TolC
LVDAASEQHRRQKYAPFVPSVLLGFSTGKFGGGLGNDAQNTDNRYDFDALVSWELRNFGLGERAARHETSSRHAQAKFEKLLVMDQVAREVTEAHMQIQHRDAQIAITRHAIKSAEDSYARNLSRIRDGQGLPLEVLQSLRALEDARRAYLTAVVDYNESQFRLQWSLGWPIEAPQPETGML